MSSIVRGPSARLVGSASSWSALVANSRAKVGMATVMVTFYIISESVTIKLVVLVGGEEW